MSGRAFLSQSEADRLRAILAVAEAQLTQSACAERLGIVRGGVAAWLHARIGSGAWPPDTARIRALLELPVLSDAEAQRTWNRPVVKRDLSLTPERRAIAAVLDSARVGPSLKYDEIERRKDERAAERAAHENHWIEAERARWGETKQTRVGPVSGMIA